MDLSPGSQGGRSWYSSWEPSTCSRLQISHLQENSPAQAPAQGEENMAPANSLAAARSPSLRSDHFITTLLSQGSTLCVLAMDVSQFRLPLQNLSLLKEIQVGKLSCKRRDREQALPGHCRDEKAPAGLWKCPAAMPDYEHKGKGSGEESLSSLLLFTQQSYNKQIGVQSLLPLSNAEKNNLCSEQPYDNKQAAQIQSSQATQNQYIFQQKLQGQ